MKQLTPLQVTLQQIAALCMLAGAAGYMWKPLTATLLFSVGALVFSPLQMLQRYEGRNFIIRRLRRQQLLGALALLVTACLMITQTFHVGFAQRNEWVVSLAVACVLELYTAFRIPSELEKE